MKKTDLIFLFFLVLCSLNFFSARLAATGVLKNISYAYMLLAVVLSAPYFFVKNQGFIFPVKMFISAVLLSLFTCAVSWGQGLSYGGTTIPYLMWFVFFYLLHKEVPLAKIEAIVLIYGFIYIVLYVFQFVHSNVVYFGFKEEFVEDRGVIRINFPGAGVLFLGYFIALNRITEKFNWVAATFLVLAMVVTIMQVTRQSIAMLFVISVFHFVRKSSLLAKLGVAAAFCMLLFYIFSTNNAITRGLLETQKETVAEGTGNIRVLASDYFLNQFSPNILTRVLGNGVPNLKSAYGQFTAQLEDNYGYYVSDVGLIGLYVYFGILPVLSYVLIFFKGFTTVVPARYLYLKYYLLFLLVTAFTSDNVYSINFMITNVFVLYGFQRVYEYNKQQQELNYDLSMAQ